jgi:radical SAM superfamily enzyme YgiQ (UPF0313 family)
VKIELVVPAAEDSARLRSLAMAILAGLTPPGHALQLRDDTVRRLDARDLDLGADLAAITATSKSVLRAYELADLYRRAGVRVVLGGIHPSAMPDEALQHADAVVCGEAEGLWERLLVDAAAGKLRSIYQHAELPDYRRPRRPRRDIFRSRRYVPVHTLQASRGCPFDCEFCSVTPFFGREFRLRDVDDLVGEIEELDGRWLMFADDNILGRPAHSRKLLRELAPLKVRWFGQASLHGLEDEENLRLLARSGCQALFIGFESVNRESLRSCGKAQNHPERYLELTRRLHDHGIAVWASFVFGLDEDTPDIFDRTLELAVASGVIMALFAILTPYPGTRLHRRLAAEGRLLDPKWWLHPRPDDFPLFRPRGMTPEQLFEGWQRTWRDFYSGGSIARRLLGSGASSLFSALAFLPLNWHQWRLTHEKIVGGKKFFLRDG